MQYHELLGDIDYRNHVFATWTDKVEWEVTAILNAINNLISVIDALKGKNNK